MNLACPRSKIVSHMVEISVEVDPILPAKLDFLRSYMQGINEGAVYPSIALLLKCLEGITVEAVEDIEPSFTACLEPISIGSTDPRLREDETNSFPFPSKQFVHLLSWPIDRESGMPKIPQNPELYPWERVSHL